MHEIIAKLIRELPQQEKRHDSLARQLLELSIVANRLGMYDASDALKKIIDPIIEDARSQLKGKNQ